MRGPKVETFALPFGQDYLWMPEWNTLALAPHLDAEGRRRALDELQAEWRRTLNVVVDPVGVTVDALCADNPDTD